VPYGDVARVLEDDGTARFTASGTELSEQPETEPNAGQAAA
jgi:hypothetical protein